MRKKFAFILGGILTIATLTTYGYDKLPFFKTTIVSDSTLVSLDKNQLVNESTAIVLGKVISSQVESDLVGLPVTDYKVKVNKVFKGTPGKEVEIRTQGGETEKMKLIPDENEVQLQIGEEVILFLNDDKGDREDKNDFDFFVVGSYQGKLNKVNGQLKNKKFEFDETTFSAELEKIEKDNKQKGLKRLKAGPNDNIDL